MVIKEKVLCTILKIEKQTIPGLMMTRIDMDVSFFLPYFTVDCSLFQWCIQIVREGLTKYDKLYDPPTPVKLRDWYTS